MSKRPMCLFALLLAAALAIPGFLGFPFWGSSPPVLPDGCQSRNALVQGRIYGKESNTLYTVLYIKQVSLIQNSETYPIENVKVNIKSSMVSQPLDVGAVVCLRGSLEQIPLPSNPGQFHERNYYYARKVKWYLEGQKLEAVRNDTLTADYIREKVKSRLRGQLQELAPWDTGGLFCAIVLGDKKEAGKENRLIFSWSGISHLLAVSGLHIAFFGWGLFKLLGKIRIPLALAAILSIVFVIQYGIFTGGSASAVRAVIMFSLSAGARIAGRTYDLLSALSLSAVLILLENPAYLCDSGFLLSFSCVLGLAVVFPAMGFSKKGKIAGAVGSGLALQAVMLPVQMYFFYEIPVFGLLVNLLVLPTGGIVLLSGAAGCLAGLLWEPLGKLLLMPGGALLTLYLKTGELISRIPCFTIITGCPEKWRIAFYYGLLLLWLMGQNRGKICEKMRILLPVLGLCFLFLRFPDYTLHLTFLDVGQGDCGVVRYGGSVYLIDGGSSSVSNCGAYRILPYLKWCGVQQVDGIFLSHMDEDHVNGAAELLTAVGRRQTSLRIKRLFLSPCEEKADTLQEIETLGKRAGCEIVYIRGGDRIKRGELLMRCLYPRGAKGESNENSQVLCLEFGKISALFTGDMEGSGESAVLKILQEEGIKADILKVPHHGSKNSTSAAFLEVLKPVTAVISCGENNRYGHPHPELLNRLTKAKVQVYSTPRQGAVFAEIDKEGAELTFQKKKSVVN